MSNVPVISIIDDDESVRVGTKRLVRSLGMIGHTFASALEFLESPRVNDTACVIADVQMPGMSGLELQRWLIANENRRPMIFITAFRDDRVRRQALKAGAICFLDKPFDAPTLIRCLEMALERRRSEGQSKLP